MKRLVDSIYPWLNERLGGRLDMLQRASRRFGETEAAQAAAAMAYYAVFSLFPLLLVLVSITSYFVASEHAQQQVVGLVEQVIPVSQSLIERNVRRVLDLRGPVGLLGLAGLLWSAGAFFTVLAGNVNRAWSAAEERGFVGRRLIGMAMIGVLLLLLILSVLSSTVLNVLPRLRVSWWEGLPVLDTFLGAVISQVVPWFFTLLLFWALYRWVPNVDVRWTTALWGAAVVAVAWELLKVAFVWYLSSGLVQYELVYGSLGTVVALMLWIYVGSLITLFGAHLSAAIAWFKNET